jgi:hypothetical protein
MKLTSALAEPAVCWVWLQGPPEAARRSQLIAGVLRTGEAGTAYQVG